MRPNDDISHWIGRLKEGDEVAAQKIWETYFKRLVQLAKNKLVGSRTRVADEEDVALSAFASFCRGAERARFPRLADRNDLWKLLVVITARKAYDMTSRERRQKRGGGKVCGESALRGSPANTENPAGMEEVIGREPTPGFAAQVAEEFQLLLDVLGDAELRTVAIKKMEGFTNEEIATQLNRSLATVERKLHLIRRIWEKEKAGCASGNPG